MTMAADSRVLVLRTMDSTDVRFVAFESASSHADPLAAAARFTQAWIAGHLKGASA